MPTPVLPDPGSAALLQQAHAQSQQSLDAQDRAGLAAAGFPASAFTPPAPQGPSVSAVALTAGPGPQAAPVGGPGADATPLDWGPSTPPSPDEVKQVAATKGFWGTVGRTALSGLLKAGKGGEDLVVGSVMAPFMSDDTADSFFKAVDDTFDPALKYWSDAQQQAEQQGQVGKVGGAAGKAVGGLSSLMFGPEAFLASSTMGSGTDSIDQGTTARTAYKLAAANLISNALGMEIPGKGPLVKRLAIGVLGVPTIDAATQEVTKRILESDGYKKLADQINPLDPTSLISSGLMGLVFGAMAGEKPKEVPKPTPEPAAPPPAAEGTPTPPPPAGPTWAGKGVTNEGAPVTPVDVTQPGGAGMKERIGVPGESLAATPPAPSAEPVFSRPQAGAIPGEPAPEGTPAMLKPQAGTVPDRPTPEPEADLAAQWRDMNDPKTPRTGVLVPAGQPLTGVVKRIVQGREQGRIVDFQQGTLVLKDKATALKVQERLKSGEDPQAVIGDVTGAGSGKTPEQTAVVQGLDSTGAVARESAVTPAEVPGKTQEMAAEGKTPVVTTPEAALQRRAEGVAAGEAQAATPVQMGPSAQAEPLAPSPTETNPVGDEEPVKERAIIQTGQGERAVIKEGPAVEGKVPVRLLDDEGNPSDQVVHVPETAFAGTTERGTEPAKELPGSEDQGNAAREAPAPARGEPVTLESPAKESTPVPAEGSAAEAASAAELKRLTAEQQAESAEDAARTKGEALKIKAKSKRERAVVERQQRRAPKIKVMEDIPDETKPREMTKGEKLRLKAAGDRLLKADEKTLEQHRAEVEKILEEVMPHMPPDDKEVFLANLLSQRREILERQRARSRPKSIEEEIEDEMGVHGIDYSDPGALDINAKEGTRTRVGDALLRPVVERLWNMRDDLRNRADLGHRGPPTRLHALLDHILQHASGDESFAARSIIQAIRKYAPDMPVNSVHEIIHPRTGEIMHGAAGLHVLDRLTGQQHIDINPNADVHPLETLLHEAVHAATVRFMADNPSHPFSREMERLRSVAEARARRLYGDETVSSHINYFSGKGERPLQLAHDLYGLTNSREFVAEALANGRFQKFLIDSERVARPQEGLRSIVHRLAQAIRGLFGIQGEKETALFNNVLDIGGRIMKAQHADMMDRQIREQAASMSQRAVEPEVNALRRVRDDDRRAIPGEGAIRSVAGNKAADMARDFTRAVRARAPRALRKLVLANETHDQIMRSNAHWFDSSGGNPMHQLTEAEQERTAVSNRIVSRAGEIAQRRALLGRAEDRKLGEIQIKTTTYGIDPTKEENEQPPSVKEQRGFKQLYQDVHDRWNALSPEAKQIYRDEWDFNTWADKQRRRYAVDVALDTYSEKDISKAQRAALYSAKTLGEFQSIIGKGKLIDVGDRNDDLVKALQDTAAINPKAGPYFHLGRHGNLVVQVKPEGDRQFGSKTEADAFAGQIRDLSPGSTAKVEELGGKWTVTYKADYVSMHENPEEAEAHAQRLRDSGLDVGPVTEKVLSSNSVPLTGGVQNLIAEATRRLGRRGAGEDTDALVHALKTSFVQMLASRSAYAASRLARKGTGGVKPEEMGRNFAEHAQSVAWNTAHLATMFRTGEALGRIRELAKEPEDGVSQKIVYKRGQVMTELGKRITQDVAQYGQGGSSAMANIGAKVGFLNYLGSPSHAAIWMTQNFTNAIPVAGPRWGFDKTLAAFSKAMHRVGGPAFRQAFLEHVYGLPGVNAHFDPNRILQAVVRAVEGDKVLGKWARGDNSHLKQLIDRGLVSTSFANELNLMKKGAGLGRGVERAFDYARMLPLMADVFNRVSTGLAGLELTGGDLAKTLDFVKEVHFDYGQENKSRVFKGIGQSWVGKKLGINSMTMFRTYTQGMIHLLYSNVKNAVFAESKSRAEAAKTVAGLVLANSLLVGVTGGAMLEPLRLAVYAYNKIFGDGDEYHDLDNSVRRFFAGITGNKTATQAITGGLPRLLGFDLSSRMGLSDLFLHDPPDLLSADKDHMMQFAASLLGPLPQAVMDNYIGARSAWERGDPLGVITAITPVKALHDAQKAFQLYSTGKQNALGGEVTRPSVGDALTQALGFKPASVANAQEREDTAYGYRQWEYQKKQDLIKQYLNAAPADRQGVMQHIRHFHEVNPGERITYADMVRAMRSRRTGEQIAAGSETRDPGVNDRLNY